MKRCNNCGWYNKDTAVRCEKCDEDSFEPVVEVEEEVPVSEPTPEPTPAPAPAPDPEPEPEPVIEPVHEEIPVKNVMQETVAFGVSAPVHKPVRQSLAATVMDASAVMGTPSETKCPKCCYPVIGYVEYCPNCGATIKAGNESAAAPETVAKTVAEPRDSKPGLKATVRDIPEELVCEEDPDTYRLVPVDALGEAPVVLKLGDVVVLGGKKYRFQK